MKNFNERILVTGAKGRLGRYLTGALRGRYGIQNVFASDLSGCGNEPYALPLDVQDKAALCRVVDSKKIAVLYHLAGALPQEAERNPKLAWELNVGGLYNVLDTARRKDLRVFWPGSIAVHGSQAPKSNCPQELQYLPDTVYGIGKLTGEQHCTYFHERFGVDVRAIRYPAILAPNAEPRGGTLAYLSEVFREARTTRHYTCYLKAHTRAPLIYIDDAVRAAIELMEAPAQRISIRSAYNLNGTSFCPAELETAIKRHLPSFQMSYRTDPRQQAVEKWPASLDDSAARKDWYWKANFGLEQIVEKMLAHVCV